MTYLRSLIESDLDGVKEVANIYLSELEIKANEEMFSSACSPEESDTIGVCVVENGDVIGFLVGTMVTKKCPLDQHFNRATPVTTSYKSAVLQHIYLKSDYIGHGYGSDLLSEMIDRIEERDVKKVYVEAWIKPDRPDAVPLLKSYGFEKLYHEDDYWTHDTFVANEVPCPVHGIKYVDCPCEGAVYMLNIDRT
jgi:GNAT superfamily N-acetyltransferase